MKAYLVGGYVRDKLLQLKPKDRDWVVVGSSPEEMKKRGFKQVGENFPVFIHPQTGEEYALARREVSTGNGHGDFAFDWRGVTLEEDLRRRDFSINAMALNLDNGELIDPCGGRLAAENKMLVMVNVDAFAEDPLRVLRAARFASRLGFRVENMTRIMCEMLAITGKLGSLSAERVYGELTKGLCSDRPAAYLGALVEVSALEAVAPELNALRHASQDPRHHAEGDAFEHTKLVVEETRRITDDEATLWAAVCHDLGKGLSLSGNHHGHEKKGVAPTKALLDRLRAPKSVKHLSEIACRHHMQAHNWRSLRAGTVYKLLDACRSFGTRPSILSSFLDVCDADERGRRPARADEQEIRSRRIFLSIAAESAKLVNTYEATGGWVETGTLSGSKLTEVVVRPALQDLSGPQIAERIRQARTQRIKAAQEAIA